MEQLRYITVRFIIGRLKIDNILYKSMDWFSRENRNRKPELFSHEDHGAFLLKFSLKPIH